MSDSAISFVPPTATVASVAPAGFGDNRGIKFQIKTGNTRWTCTLQDRSYYECMKKTASANSTDSVESNASSTNSQ